MLSNQNKSKRKTILSHTGSRIVPSLLTWFNRLATIPSIESEMPITAIKVTNKGILMFSIEYSLNKYIETNNLEIVIRFGKRNKSLSVK